MIAAIAFYIFAAVLIGSAALVVSSRNPVHSVLFLILAFFNAAALFLLAGAEFLAMILVIVYVGAVAVLFLFVVMMLDVNFDQLARRGPALRPGRRGGRRRAVPGAGRDGRRVAVRAERDAAPGLRHAGGPVQHRALGQLIYTNYVFLFQPPGLILLVAMIGAIVLTHRERGGTSKRQNIAPQQARTVASTLQIMTVSLGAGTRQTGILRPLPPPMKARPTKTEHKPVHAHPGDH